MIASGVARACRGFFSLDRSSHRRSDSESDSEFECFRPEGRRGALQEERNGGRV
jgi:hypothetical protein